MNRKQLDVAGTQTVHGLLKEKVRAHPDKEFLVFEDESGQVTSLTYRQFSEKVDNLAGGLVKHGIRPDDKVAVMVTNSPEFLVSWFAINQAGAVLVPVNILYAADELQYLLNSADCAGFVTEQKFLPVFGKIADVCPRVRVRLAAKCDGPVPGFLRFEDLVQSAADVPGSELKVGPDSLTQIIYTSGTTSRPKGAMITHRSSITQGIAVAMLFGMTSAERSCVVLPLFHVNGQYVSVMPTLTVGGTVVLFETFSARKYWSRVRAHRCTFISIVPMLLRTMLAQPPDKDDANHEVRYSFYAMLTTDEEWDSFESRFGVTLLEGYGLSETLGICTSNPVIHGTIQRHCIGLPLLGRQIRVVDAGGESLPAGEVGRILVCGEGMFSGYYKNPEATKACMTGEWFETGDNGSIDQHGYLHFFDRSKDVIKRAGENIAATEVERVLNEHPGILESAVIAVPDPLRDEAIKAFVVLKPGHVLAEAEITAWCAERLAKFKVPSFYEFRDSLPRTSIGKIVKYVLKAESAQKDRSTI